VVLFYCGKPVSSLLDGETREILSIWQLQRFDFWVREPGHLALALMHAYTVGPDRLEKDVLHAGLQRLMADDQVDVRRVMLPGGAYNIFEDFDSRLSLLTSRALVSDRPSFARSRTHAHKVVLEAAGVEIARKVLDTCPAFEWYRRQCEMVANFFHVLEGYDPGSAVYLAPELDLITAATTTLRHYLALRYDRTFGVTPPKIA
jgi:hypothetical protein